MKALLLAASCSITLMGSVSVMAQSPKPADAKSTAVAAAITSNTTPTELARLALAAQGGDKFKSLKSMVLRGSVDLYAPNSTQSIPGGFIWVVAGDKVRLEVDARPAVSFKQIYDGQRAYSSLPGVEAAAGEQVWVAGVSQV